MVFVIFRLRAPQAHAVTVTGFWIADPTPLVKIDSALFEVRLALFSTNLYEYLFLVDGLPFLDPSNTFFTTRGSVVENRLLVPGGFGDLLAVQSVPHGTINSVWYPSPTLGKERRMQVYTPAGYGQSNNKYPVL